MSGTPRARQPDGLTPGACSFTSIPGNWDPGVGGELNGDAEKPGHGSKCRNQLGSGNSNPDPRFDDPVSFTNTYSQNFIHTHTPTRSYSYSHTPSPTHSYIHTYIHSHIHTHSHTRSYTHTLTHTHTHTLSHSNGIPSFPGAGLDRPCPCILEAHLGMPRVTFISPLPAKWKVLSVICVEGSPMLWAASRPTASPGSHRERCHLSCSRVLKLETGWEDIRGQRHRHHLPVTS